MTEPKVVLAPSTPIDVVKSYRAHKVRYVDFKEYYVPDYEEETKEGD